MVLSSIRVLPEELSPNEGFGLEQAEGGLKVVNQALKFFQDSTQPFPEEVAVYFGPTGPLQELAIANGWSEVYLLLSEEFDGVSHSLRNSDTKP